MTINVTKTYLPPMDEYVSYLNTIWERAWLTNNGPLVRELEETLKAYLGVPNLLFCTNGTIVLQMALKALALNDDSEIITTPFSYVATATAILWEGCKPVFVDINERDMNIDVEKIEAAITPRTRAILATHVYGNPCDVERIAEIAHKHQLTVIYDGAHAFGATYKGKQLLSYGDIITCSFHATKVFHTTEGGCIIVHDPALAHKIFLSRQFGHVADDYYAIGINGKNSELHAAMGLCNLPHLAEIIAARKAVSEQYDSLLADTPLKRPVALPDTGYNYAYYPVVFTSEEELQKVRLALEAESIFTRRYFYPSLNNLPYHQGAPCPVSENISLRVLSLPLFYGLAADDVARICSIIKANLL
jgi:dTDP-4-amino-4,6-dideoxygalactose transaminase